MFKHALILVNTESESGSRGNRTPWKRLLADQLTPELPDVNNSRGTKGQLCVLSFCSCLLTSIYEPSSSLGGHQLA